MTYSSTAKIKPINAMDESGLSSPTNRSPVAKAHELLDGKYKVTFYFNENDKENPVRATATVGKGSRAHITKITFPDSIRNAVSSADLRTKLGQYRVVVQPSKNNAVTITFETLILSPSRGKRPRSSPSSSRTGSPAQRPSSPKTPPRASEEKKVRGLPEVHIAKTPRLARDVFGNREKFAALLAAQTPKSTKAPSTPESTSPLKVMVETNGVSVPSNVDEELKKFLTDPQKKVLLACCEPGGRIPEHVKKISSTEASGREVFVVSLKDLKLPKQFNGLLVENALKEVYKKSPQEIEGIINKPALVIFTDVPTSHPNLWNLCLNNWKDAKEILVWDSAESIHDTTAAPLSMADSIIAGAFTRLTAERYQSEEVESILKKTFPKNYAEYKKHFEMVGLYTLLFNHDFLTLALKAMPSICSTKMSEEQILALLIPQWFEKRGAVITAQDKKLAQKMINEKIMTIPYSPPGPWDDAGEWDEFLKESIPVFLRRTGPEEFAPIDDSVVRYLAKLLG